MIFVMVMVLGILLLLIFRNRDETGDMAPEAIFDQE
jgi:hypothetical protein